MARNSRLKMQMQRKIASARKSAAAARKKASEAGKMAPYAAGAAAAGAVSGAGLDVPIYDDIDLPLGQVALGIFLARSKSVATRSMGLGMVAGSVALATRDIVDAQVFPTIPSDEELDAPEGGE